MNKSTRNKFVVAGMAAFLAIAASPSMAFSIGLTDSLDKEDRSESGEKNGTGSAFRWWSLFQEKLPERRVRENGYTPGRGIGGWLDRQREQPGYEEIVGAHNAAMLGLDRRAKVRFFKEKVVAAILYGLRIKRDLIEAHMHKPPAPIPLPATPLLFGSALVSMFAFTRRKLRRREHVDRM